MAKLVLFRADASTLDIVLSRERTTIGRRPDNDVCLPHPAVSAEHAAVVTITSDSFLEDLGSTNGTLVNGKRITKHLLRDRDEIDIGRQRLVYLADETVDLRPPAHAPGGDKPSLHEEREQPEKRAAIEIDRFIAAEVGAANEEGADTAGADSANAASAAPSLSEPVAVVRVLNGPSAGREVAVDKPEIVIGRVGVQVAALRNSDGKLRLVLLEGAPAPTVNGEPIGDDGVELRVGDCFDIAGAKVEIAARGDT